MEMLRLLETRQTTGASPLLLVFFGVEDMRILEYSTEVALSTDQLLAGSDASNERYDHRRAALTVLASDDEGGFEILRRVVA